MMIMEILKIMITKILTVMIIMEILSQDHHVKVDFLEFWIMRPGYYACIFLESTGFAIVTNHHDQCDDTSGITHITWVISYCLARISGMHEDPEERNDYSRFSSSSSSSRHR